MSATLQVSAAGQLLWSCKTGAHCAARPVLLFWCGFALRPPDTSDRPIGGAGASIYAPATIDADGTVLIGTMRGENCLYAINGDTGAVKWKGCGGPDGEMNSGPAIGGT
eukprot:SAG31_NODE_4905_length_2875_cov_2.277017_2_plen_109_part_00